MGHPTTWRAGSRRLAASLALGIAALPLPAASPLCQLALQQWAPTNFQAVVFHQEALGNAEQELVQELRDARARNNVNLDVVDADLSTLTPALRGLWSTQTNAEPPWLVLQSAAPEPTPRPIWSGRISSENVTTLLDSPARRTVAAALLRGETAAWVLVESGNTVQDEAAVDQLAATLKSIEKAARNPAAASNAPALTNVSFSLVRVTRTDPAEAFFVASLLAGWNAPSARPVAVPVFGRGHLLPPLVGKRITTKNIQQACKRLTGPFARDPKDPLPNRNLLLAAAWDARGADGAPAPAVAQALTPTPTPAPTPAPDLATANTTTSAAPAAPEAAGKSSTHLLNRIFLIGGAVLLGAGFLTFSLSRRRARPEADRRST